MFVYDADGKPHELHYYAGYDGTHKNYRFHKYNQGGDNMYYLTLINKVLNSIRANYSAYLPNKSITLLSVFLSAYKLAITSIYSLSDCFDAFFQLYVNEKYSVTKNIGWSTAILNHNYDEESAFDSFFELWDEFMSLLQKGGLVNFLKGYNKATYVSLIKNVSLSGELIDSPRQVCVKSQYFQKSFISLLNNIRITPALYIGGKSLIRLSVLINGHFLAFQDANGSDDAFEKQFKTFFAAKGIFMDSGSCPKVILENSPEDKKGFDLFFEVFDEYKKEHICIN